LHTQQNGWQPRDMVLLVTMATPDWHLCSGQPQESQSSTVATEGEQKRLSSYFTLHHRSLYISTKHEGATRAHPDNWTQKFFRT